ncbi:outer membrane protein [Legionella drancourtii]|uniref:Uncharacterized protein n=1 Tax=Legionella drancourtii LLAP12 TaxID=658187 RepID=G9ETR6_9GAMM|nr:outer membrane beta-barrel protein [Legionella drancourtii]EHL29267.1 hypothetical protein LDG_8702 [Legionella drancourtii LLAP12]
MINKTLYEKSAKFFLITFLASVWFVFTLASSVCHAAIAHEKVTLWWYSPVLTLSGGIAAANVGRSQTLGMANDYTTYQYSAQNSSSQRFILGVYTGTEIALNSKFLLQMGIGFYDPGAFSSKYNPLIQGVDRESSDQFFWHYKVKNQSFLAEAKLLGMLRKQIHIYLTLGLGTAFNHAYDYTVNVPPFLTFTPEFTNHTETSFTYAIGIGMEADVAKNFRLGVGYRFANLGQANLGKGFLDDKIFSETLRQSNFYMHALLAQVTWHFGK